MAIKLTEYEYLSGEVDLRNTILEVTIGARGFGADTGHWFIFDGVLWKRAENVVISDEHKQVHNGKMWDISTLHVGVVNDLFADLVIENGADELHCVFTESTSGSAHASISEAPTVTAATGTAAIVKNANRAVGDTGAPTALKDPTITDIGTLLVEWFDNGGIGGAAAGGSTNRDTELILKPSTKYLFRMANKQGSAADMSWLIHGDVN